MFTIQDKFLQNEESTEYNLKLLLKCYLNLFSFKNFQQNTKYH